MGIGSVQIIIRLDSQSKFQMFTLFSAAILEDSPSRLLNFARLHFEEYLNFGIRCFLYSSTIAL